jgi:hypothetical protein
MSRLTTFVLGVGAILCASAQVARAQDSTTPPPAPPPSSSAPSYSSGGGSHGMLGVGAIAYMGGPTGLSFVYDPGQWHIDTLIGYSALNSNDVFSIGARFWYHVKSSANADLSVGAGGSLAHVSPPMGGNSSDGVWIEAGGLIRVFLAPSVALGVGGGLVVGAADADGFTIGSQANGFARAIGLLGDASLHYFF